MAWHEKNVALEAQLRVTLLDVEGELCMGHGRATTAGETREAGTGALGYSGWGDPVPDACGLPGPAEGFGLVQLRNGVPEAATRGRKMTNVNSTLQQGMSLERDYGATRAKQSHRITVNQIQKDLSSSELIGCKLGRNTTLSATTWHYMPPPLSSNTSSQGRWLHHLPGKPILICDQLFCE